MTPDLYNMDCLDLMGLFLANDSVDAIVTDPPYGLAFMGKKWDHGVPGLEFWEAAYAVLKPGGHLLAFGGARTYHRLASVIEDAGFEIRDQIMWVYGQGFPKSLDVSKAIDKARVEDVEPVRAICRLVRAAMDEKGMKSKDLAPYFDNCHPRLIDHWAARDTDSQPSLPTMAQWEVLRDVLALGCTHDAEVARLNGRKGEAGDTYRNADVIGEHAGTTPGFVGNRFVAADTSIRARSAAALEWEGWGTALKPAHEPIVVARKPFKCSVAKNVAQWRTGAINIDGCRIGFAEGDTTASSASAGSGAGRETANIDGQAFGKGMGGVVAPPHALGRWPANLIHDGSDEVLAAFPDAPGPQGPISTDDAPRNEQRIYGVMARGRGAEPSADSDNEGAVGFKMKPGARRLDSGSAARFFYVPKTSPADRHHGLTHLVEISIEWSDKINRGEEWESVDRKVKLLVDTEPSPPKVTAVFGAQNSCALEWNTTLFGSGTTDLCQLGMTSTTATKTNSTTLLTILNCFPGCTISASTADVNYGTESGGSPAENADTCSRSATITNDWMASALGASPVAWPMPLRISASAARSGHPTVKPTDLMAYLCRLVTPPGGTVLDPFMGSGSTGKAALREGFKFIGCELEPEYFAIAQARIAAEIK